MVVPFGAFDTAPVVVGVPLYGPCVVGPVSESDLRVSAAPGWPGDGATVSMAEICESVPKVDTRLAKGVGV